MTSVSKTVKKSNSRLPNWANNETLLYIAKRLLQALVTLLLASALSFAIIQLAPGNFIDTLRNNPVITPERIAELEREFGLDQPGIVQYFKWLWGIITRFDFGISFTYFPRPVGSILLERIPATLLLALVSIFVTWTIALPLGILSAVKQNTLADRIVRSLSYLGQGFPSFITALILLIFAQITYPLFPIGGMTSVFHESLSPLGKLLDYIWHLILPTLALSITSFAGLVRLTRGQLLDVLRQDYIQTARAKGLPENKVIYVHALRNAINPLITLLGFEFAALLSGSFITEFFFNWPGLGRLVLEAVQAQDLYLVMASLMMGATMLIVGNLLADLLLKVSDPRISLEDLK